MKSSDEAKEPGGAVENRSCEDEVARSLPNSAELPENEHKVQRFVPWSKLQTAVSVTWKKIAPPPMSA